LNGGFSKHEKEGAADNTVDDTLSQQLSLERYLANTQVHKVPELC